MPGGCEWHPDDAGYVSLDEMKANAGCPLPANVTGFVIESRIVDQHGHELDGDNDPLGAHGCEHRDTPEWKAAHRPTRKEPPTMPTIPAAPLVPESTPPEPPVALALNDAPAAPVPVVESVGVDAAVSQVKSLVPGDASPALLVGGAAVLAVIGGAIKFGPQVLKARAEKQSQEHEARMKELELKQEQQQKQDDQHKSCAIERANLEAKVAALTIRLDDVSSRAEKAGAASLNMGDFDPDALEERLAAIEKKLKQPPAKGRKKA